ncbi:MAG: hypothetical protein AABX51_07455, partial [Nanoarchaeota archaeon]
MNDSNTKSKQRSEQRRVLNIGTVFFALAFLLVISFFFAPYMRFIGFTVLEQAGVLNISFKDQIVASPLGSWEPLGAASKGNNLFGYDSPLNKYYFNYGDSKINLTYFIATTDAANGNLFDTISIKAKYNGEDYSFQPLIGGASVILGGKAYDASSSLLRRSLISINRVGNSLIVSYNISNGNDFTKINLEYAIRGKSLAIRASSADRKVTQLQFVKTGGQGQSESVNPDLSYADQFLKGSLRKGNLFLKVYADFSESSASRLEYNHPYKLSSTQSGYNSLIRYTNLTDKKPNSLNEKVYITFSENILDVYPKYGNAPSQNLDKLKNKFVLEFWQIYPCSLTTAFRTCVQPTVAKYHSYGFKELIVMLDDYTSFIRPEFLPIAYDGPSRFEELNQNLSKYGDNLVVYINYNDVFPNSKYYLAENMAKDQNGNPILTWNGPDVDGYGLRTDKLGVIETEFSNYMKPLGVDGYFFDALGNGWTVLDKDVNGVVKGKYAENIRQYSSVLLNAKQPGGELTLTEGGGTFTLLGPIDAAEGELVCCSGGRHKAIIPDYNLKVTKNTGRFYGVGYYRRYFDANNDIYYNSISEADMDDYATSTILLGNIGFIDSPMPWLHNIDDRTIIRHYYLIQHISALYGSSTAETIEYHSSGNYRKLEDAIINNYDFVNPQIKENFQNGLVIYGNRNSQTSWQVSLDAETYTLPSNGFLARAPSFFEYSGLVNGRRVDIAETPDYVFLDPRGATINFTLHDNNYYTAERFDIGKGKKPINFTFTITDKTSIITSEQLVLKRLPQTGSNIRVTMNSATGIPILVEQLGGGPPPPPIDTIPPIRASGSPQGTLPAGTTVATLSTVTNENAICKYSTTAGVAYNSMPGTFDTTGSNSHSKALTALADGASYSYYVRCSDQAGNSNIGGAKLFAEPS